MTTLITKVAPVINAMNAWGNGPHCIAKTKFHRAAKSFLKAYAKDVLKLTSDQFEVSSCLGGDAVLGEVTLHTDNIYVQICQPYFDRSKNVMFRTCKDRKDYCGGSNNWCSLIELTQFNVNERLNNKFFAI
jgi:hypothetical protein